MPPQKNEQDPAVARFREKGKSGITTESKYTLKNVIQELKITPTREASKY